MSCSTHLVDRGDHRCRAKSTRPAMSRVPSLSSKRRCNEAAGSRSKMCPPAPTTRCQGMPRPAGHAAIARPAVRAPPRSFSVLASWPYVSTRARGICFTKRYTASQDIVSSLSEQPSYRYQLGETTASAGAREGRNEKPRQPPFRPVQNTHLSKVEEERTGRMPVRGNSNLGDAALAGRAAGCVPNWRRPGVTDRKQPWRRERIELDRRSGMKLHYV